MKRLTLSLVAIVCGLFFPGCGGGGNDGKAAASSPAAVAQTVHQLHGIVRPDGSGRWYVQDDVDHAPSGIVGVTQTGEYLEVQLDRKYSHAGTIQVSMDDDFNGYCTAGSNLGLSAARIRIKCNGVQIDPANVYSYAPVKGAGNLWINVTMVTR